MPRRWPLAAMLALTVAAFAAVACAPAAATPGSPVPAAAATPVGRAPESPGAPPIEWAPVADDAAADQGVQITRLGTLAHGPAYLIAIVAIVAPADAPDVFAPAPSQLRGSDSLGHTYSVEYTEVARSPGLTIAAATLRDLPPVRTTFALEVDGLDRRAPIASTTPLAGRWRIGLAEQRVDDLRASSLTLSGLREVTLGGVAVRYASSAAPGGPFVAVEVRRSGAPAETVYRAIELDTGALRPLAPAVGDCYFAWWRAPTPTLGGPTQAAVARPAATGGNPAPTSTPAGADCARLAAAPSPGVPSVGPAVPPASPTLPGGITTVALATPSGSTDGQPVGPGRCQGPVPTVPPRPPAAPAGRTAGPYLTLGQAVCLATRGLQPEPNAVDAWFATYGDWGRTAEASQLRVLPERELWVVWMHAPGQGPAPTCKPGNDPAVCLTQAPGGDKDSFFHVIDATTGFWYLTGYGRPDWLGCPTWANPGRPSLGGRANYPGLIRPTPTPTPAGPGPHPAAAFDLSGLEPTPVRTVDLAPQRAEREKATLLVRHPDCTNEAFLVEPGQADDVFRRLPAGDRLVVSAPPASLMGQRAPPPSTAVPAAAPPTPAPGTPTVTSADVAEANRRYPIGGKIGARGPITVESVELVTSKEVRDRIGASTGLAPDALVYLVTLRGDFGASGPPGAPPLQSDRAYRAYDPHTGGLLFDVLGRPPAYPSPR